MRLRAALFNAGRFCLLAFLVSLIVVPMCAAFAEGCANSVVQLSGDYVQPPTNGVEFLKNIKLAIDDDVFLQDKLYVDDGWVWTLFGGQSVYKSDPRLLSRKLFVLTYFPADTSLMDDKVRESEKLRVALEYIVERVTTLQVQNMLGLHLSQSDVENVFGREAVKAPSPLHPEPRMPDQIQYRELQYHLQSKTSKKVDVDVVYLPDGRLEDVIVTVQKR